MKKERKVTWLELFFDLIFVVGVSSANHHVLQIGQEPEKTWFYLLEYLLMITPMWWAWVGQTMFFNRYGEDLLQPQIYMMAQMALLILMTASFNLNFDKTYFSFILCYLGIRLITVIEYFMVSKHCDQVYAKTAILLGKLFSIGIIVTGMSMLFEGTIRYAVMFLGIFLDILFPLLYRTHLKKFAVDFPHLAERFGLFVIITFGESIVVVTGILSTNTYDLSVILKVLLLFGLICTMFWSYYDHAESVMNHQLKTNGQLLLYGHYFILVPLMIFAVASHFLIVDTINPVLTLTMFYSSATVFYFAKHIIFYYHRKKTMNFSLSTAIFMLAGFVISYLVILFFQLPNEIALLFLIILFGLDSYQFNQIKNNHVKN